MQFHLNGFEGSGNPLHAPPHNGITPDFQASLPEEVDVLIVGAGPAGLLLGTQLSLCPDITTRIIETKPGALERGQADGLHCRTIEVFEAFSISEQILKEAFWVNEVAFWTADKHGVLQRSGRLRDTAEDLSEFPHIILNQARLHGIWLERMKWSPSRLEPSYSRRVVGMNIPPADSDDRITVDIDRLGEDGKTKREIAKAKYVVGCDGAKSAVRNSLGLDMKGDFGNHAWGVLDALIETDFPDIRLKTNIRSANDGTILLIPREGGYLTRFYIELEKHDGSAHIRTKDITADTIVQKAQRIFHPYTFNAKQIVWWSVYEVGQRLTDRFDNIPQDQSNQQSPRVFIAGDACHTHSAKAGQGMNVSMNDCFNLGWKLISVLRGLADPALLRTYNDERRVIAQRLIDFDRDMSRLYAANPETIDATVFQDFFDKQARWVAGLGITYQPSIITLPSGSVDQTLATGLEIGSRFHSAQVLRIADAKPVQLGHVMKADARWRIVLFGDEADPTSSASAIWRICDYLENQLLPRYTPHGADIDSVIDVRGVVQQPRQNINITKLPHLLCPHLGRLGIRDYEKAFTDEESYGFGFGDIYRKRGINRQQGCLIIVRPDQYVSAVLPLWSAKVMSIIDKFFAKFLKVQRKS